MPEEKGTRLEKNTCEKGAMPEENGTRREKKKNNWINGIRPEENGARPKKGTMEMHQENGNL